MIASDDDDTFVPSTIDLNADLGEGCPNDRSLLDGLVTSASIACGAHAGDPGAALGGDSKGARFRGISLGASSRGREGVAEPASCLKACSKESCRKT